MRDQFYFYTSVYPVPKVNNEAVSLWKVIEVKLRLSTTFISYKCNDGTTAPYNNITTKHIH